MNLFEHVGLPLERDRLIPRGSFVPEPSLKRLAKVISTEIETSTLTSSPMIQRIIFSNLQDFFDVGSDFTDDNFRQITIVRISNYLIQQDLLECRSLKEVHALVSGLYDSVLQPIISFICAR